ncbi:hypothetical protein LE191_04225 [Janthinobacterium sp. HSC-3S05]|uniref:hypothetical protein n=1 Tax=Janthinobacterium lividum TaxID=29581 RepID=UPI001CD87FCD|nr:hypothetical protein [Janthinobacterium lividum]MCA1859316.1 hypothetical protein [Janthinobacterium lividum]MCL6483323.1 hypothetical protein [Janthinobacterium lividum]
MFMNDQTMDPNAAQAANPAAPAGMLMTDMQKMKLMQAMRSMNAHQQPATSEGAATANALASGLNGYMQAMQMQKMGKTAGGQ